VQLGLEPELVEGLEDLVGLDVGHNLEDLGDNLNLEHNFDLEDNLGYRLEHNLVDDRLEDLGLEAPLVVEQAWDLCVAALVAVEEERECTFPSSSHRIPLPRSGRPCHRRTLGGSCRMVGTQNQCCWHP